MATETPTTPRLRVVAVVQARASSQRLPGKVLSDLGGRPVLDWVLRAARAAREVDDVVLATSIDESDDPVAALAAGREVRVARGPLDDVLGRFIHALRDDDAAAIVRLTADCPLLDPQVIDLLVRTWRANPRVDYLSTVNPRCLPRGLDVEVVSRRALEDVATYVDGPDRVHVTSAVYRQPERYEVTGLTLHPDASDLRATLDTVEDAALLKGLVDVFGDRLIPWREVVRALRERPELVALNAAVRQKDWHEG